jgi:hypothetical protein
MSAPNWNMARSDGSDSPCQDIRVFARLSPTQSNTAAKYAPWHCARDLDARTSLINEFAIPPGIASGSAEDHIIRREEG